MPRRRSVSPFNLSFLDIMFCGFGAVVLLVLILDANTVSTRKNIHADLRAEALRVERRLVEQQKLYAQVKNRLNTVDELVALNSTQTRAADADLTSIRQELALLEGNERDKDATIGDLGSRLRGLEDKNTQLERDAVAKESLGTKVRTFQGEGERQYLTGLKLGGKRVLILLDASASMLDETLVNIIRRRNMDDASKRQSAKWQRALAVIEWLVANLPPSSLYQIYSFNVEVEPTIAEEAKRWLPATDRRLLDQAVSHLRKVIPDKGTSLYNAFSLAAQLQPKPDNLLLITDGLPTQGKSAPSRKKVSASKRLEHFRNAFKTLPQGIPVNTILLPLEGDAFAAAAFWELAVETRGAFLTPSRDWP